MRGHSRRQCLDVVRLSGAWPLRGDLILLDVIGGTVGGTFIVIDPAHEQ